MPLRTLLPHDPPASPLSLGTRNAAASLLSAPPACADAALHHPPQPSSTAGPSPSLLSPSSTRQRLCAERRRLGGPQNRDAGEAERQGRDPVLLARPRSPIVPCALARLQSRAPNLHRRTGLHHDQNRRRPRRPNPSAPDAGKR